MNHNLKRKTFFHICFLLLVGILLIPRISLSHENDSGIMRDESTSAEPYILESINRIRREYHLPILTISPSLQLIARNHSRYMAKYGYLGHEQSGLDFKTRIEKAHLKGWREIGENVGRSRGYRNNADTIVSGWMESKHHRENILTAGFDMTGIGTARADDGTLYATQVFMGSENRHDGPTR